ncbi:hypothetical protein EJ03DRAFT_387346 [Teratosphaeria nubilosa]|uniref:J domain-containing protein n=1 Tax=Teratosphaeria nubilosa TaxID=161662 RepID=A0A6G1LJH1_9PEZI|nr:hypothetical protein EJ03DRAFT_387346 [Teratosphaeria nubilosa]
MCMRILEILSQEVPSSTPQALRVLRSGAVPFDPFEALGLSRDASNATVKSRYRELARKYHPNRQQGSEEAKAVLCEQFHTVHQAWRHLKDPDKRRRYVELLRLAEEQAELETRMFDLVNGADQHSPSNYVNLDQDGHVSSDADDDVLPRIGTLQRRRTTLERSVKEAKHLGDRSLAKETQAKGRGLVRKDSKNFEKQEDAHSTDTGSWHGDYFSLRRSKLEKLRRKEIYAFECYRNAMVNKFQAELEAERTKEIYERSRWRREYFERAPRQTAERMRSFQHFMSAVRAIGSQPPRRRNRSTVSYGGQILSTEGAVDNSQYLAPDNSTSGLKSRPWHRRAYSSDISGDQTSSDEGSSGGYASPRPGMLSWTWGRHHSRHTSLDAFQLPPISPENGSLMKRPEPEHDVPFRMVVKRPTGLNGQPVVEEDSSPESNGTTPRSPFLDPRSPSQRTFTLVQNSSMSEIFRTISNGQHSLLPSFNSNQGASKRPAVSTADACHFRIKRLPKPEWSHIFLEKVHELSQAEKSWMLGAHPDADADPAEILKRLSGLDSNVASRFMIKPDAKEIFRFRLIYNDGVVVKAPDQSSYIALSYRRTIRVQKRDNHFTLPLEAAMFQAVWDERISDQEGVWIDQISIDQQSREETTISMSAMDMVYRSARLVVIALDDLELEESEGRVLESHMDEYTRMLHVPPGKRFRGKQPPYLETHEDLYQVLQKILRSPWFKRAWCRHEMRLARDHVFLVPCKSAAGRSVVRFTSNCFTHLMALAAETPFEAEIEMVKPALNAFFRDRSKLGPNDRHLANHHGNWTTVVAEVFWCLAGGDPNIPARQRAADALKDKISIILNTMECGLALTPEMRDPAMPLTKSEGQYMLLILALAAQDPGALCSVGPPMRLVAGESNSPLSPTASSTWLFEPTNVDSGLNNYRTLHRLPGSAIITTGLSLGEHFVQLDLKFLKPGNDPAVHRALDDPRSLQLARHFTSHCNKNKYGRNRHRYLLTDPSANRHFGDMREVYEQTLACIFECGPDWVEDICQRYGVSRWKQDGETAWNLLVALKNTDGKWPVEAWSTRAAGFIMDFVNFLVIRGMPQRQILHCEAWRPIWVKTENGGRILTFVPPGDIRPAIPTALVDDDDYIHLARLWILEARYSFQGSMDAPSETANTDDWTLIGKSVLFSDDLASQHLRFPSGVWREKQRIFGREDPEIQRLLRERSFGQF